MKRLLVTVALACFAAVPAFAALQYEFSQKNTSEDTVTPMTDLSARAVVDGDRSRVDFLAGNLYPPGTYVISTDGSRRLFFVDPMSKSYTEFNTAGVATALATSNIKIDNLKSSVDLRDDRPIIAGIPSDHTVLTIAYDISVTMRAIPLKQHVTTTIDTWSTSRYGDVGQNELTNALRTGNPELDMLLESEAGKIKGFPLRQIVTTRTSVDTPSRGSQLKIPSTRTFVRETWVTAVRETTPEPVLFTVPATYHRADMPALPKSATETLQFDPPTK
jgi:hypothetical protein